MTSRESRQNANNTLHQRVERLISLRPEEYHKLPPVEVQGLLGDLTREVRDLHTHVERLEQAQQELAQARQQASELFEFAPAGYVILDSRGVVSNVNITLCDMLGVSRNEIVGAPFSNRVEPQYLDALRSYLEDISSTGQRLCTEVELSRRDGSTFYALLQTVPMYEKSEIIYRVSVTDVTESKRAEAAQRESEQKYRDLAELLPEIVFETDLHGSITLANATGLTRFGLSLEDLKNGISVFELVVPNQRNTAAERFSQVLQGAELGPYEYTVQTRNGATFPAVVHSALIKRNGEAQGVRGVAIDITERKKAEEALRESENLLRSTLDNMLEGCVIIDFNWRFLYANDAVGGITGVPKEERIGRNVMEVLPGIEKQEAFAHVKRCMEERIADHYETEVTFPSGKKIWMEQRVEPVPEGVMLLYTDITVRKAAEERLKNDVERLQRIYGITQLATIKPAGMLMIEHRLIERVIALLVREKAKMEQDGELEHEFIDYVVDFFRIYADKTHHGKEEAVLFKALEAKPLSLEHKKMMDDLVQEHIQARKLVSDLVKAKEVYIAGGRGAREQLILAADGLVELYPQHIEKEDKLFFLPTMEYFTPQELDDMLIEFWEYDRQMVHRRFTEDLEALAGTRTGTATG